MGCALRSVMNRVHNESLDGAVLSGDAHHWVAGVVSWSCAASRAYENHRLLQGHIERRDYESCVLSVGDVSAREIFVEDLALVQGPSRIFLASMPPFRP